MDLVVGHEGADRRQCADHPDVVAGEPDLLLGFAQGGVDQGLVPISPSAGKGDLSCVPFQVRPALREDEAGILRPAVHRDQHRGVGSAVRVKCLGLGGGEQQLAQFR